MLQKFQIQMCLYNSKAEQMTKVLKACLLQSKIWLLIKKNKDEYWVRFSEFINISSQIAQKHFLLQGAMTGVKIKSIMHGPQDKREKKGKKR